MKHLITLSVRHPWTVLALSVLLVAAGLWSAVRLPLDAVPDITNVQVQVNTQVEGLAPEQIEQQVTFPVEVGLAGLPRAVQVRSITRPGLSQVTVVFEDGANVFLCRQLVSERLQGVLGALPEGSTPRLGPIATGLGEVYFYTLEAKRIASGPDRVRQLMDLRDLQEWFVKPRLLTVPGVAEINAIGGYERQAVVSPNPRRLAARGIALGDLVEALKRANRNVGGGIIEQGTEQFSVAARGALSSLDDIRRVAVRSDESLAAVSVADVADVSWGAGLRAGTATVDAHEAIVCSAIMLAGANSRVVARLVHDRLQEVGASLPDWATVRTLYSRTDLVNATLTTVAHNLVLGAGFVVGVLVLMLGNWRAALITAATIPLAALGAVIVMLPLGLSGNLMSLGAIDFGILVGGAVIVMERVVRALARARARWRRALTPDETRATVLEATIEARTAAGFGQLITIVPLVPLFGLAGVEGKTFTPMAATLGLALGAAFVVSFCATPALACLLLGSAREDREPWLARRARAIYESVLDRSLGVPGGLLAVGLVLLAVAGLLFGRLGAVFMPQLDEGSLAFQFIRPATISMTEAVRQQEATERILLEFPEVATAFARMGTAEIAFDACGVDTADATVALKPRQDWPRQANGRRRTKPELVEAIQRKLAGRIPGQEFLVTQPIQLRFNELLEGTRADVAVKVFGDDLGRLHEVAAKVARVVEGVRGAGDVELESSGIAPVLSIAPRRDVLASVGLSSGAVLEAVETGIAGEEAGLIFEGAKRYPLVVRLGARFREDLETLRLLPVAVGPASTRPLGALAEFRYVDSYPSVSREQAKRRTAVLINPRGRDVESFVLEARRAVRQSVRLPEGYYLEWGGAFQNLEAARARLAVLTPAALGLVFLMIYAAFGDALLALLVFACVPLALVGGVLMLFVCRIPFSISAGVGFIALAGIAVLNGVVLVSTSLRLKAGGLDAGRSVRAAALECLRPVLMTALVEVFGFLPMMLSRGMGAEVQRPLATVVVGGVISSTVLTLLMLPAWQAWIEHARGRVLHGTSAGARMVRNRSAKGGAR